jgi:hypothetical protein
MGENETVVSIGNLQEGFIVLSILVLFFDIKHINTDVSKKPDHLGGNIFIRENLDILESHALTGSNST